MPRPAPFGFKYYGKRNIYDNYKKQSLQKNENNLQRLLFDFEVAIRFKNLTSFVIPGVPVPFWITLTAGHQSYLLAVLFASFRIEKADVCAYGFLLKVLLVCGEMGIECANYLT